MNLPELSRELTRHRRDRPRGAGGVVTLCELLEQRRVLSVSASLDATGLLTLTENAATDTASIVANATSGGRFLVSGTGLSQVQFSGVSSFKVSGVGSTDSQSVTLSNMPGIAFALTGGVTISNVATVSFLQSQSFSAASLDVSGGTTVIGGPTMTTAGEQTYAGPVILTGNTALSSTGNSSIRFNSSVDGSHTLSVNTPGDIFFDGPVGSTTALFSLTTEAVGGTNLNGGTVSTTMAQIYDSAVSVGVDTALTSAFRDVTFSGTLNGAHKLIATISVESVVNFMDTVGGVVPLASVNMGVDGVADVKGGLGVWTTGPQFYYNLSVKTPTTTLTSTGNGQIQVVNVSGGGLTVDTGGPVYLLGFIGFPYAPLTGDLTVDGSGPITLGLNAFTEGSQLYSGPVTVGDGNAAESTGAGNITFGGTVDGGALTVVTTGTATFDAAIGPQSPMQVLTVAAGGLTVLNGGVINCATQTYDSPVVLGDDNLLNSVASVTFGSTVDGPHSLTVSAAGNLTFMGAVGASQPLTSIVISAADDVAANSIVAGAIAQIISSRTSTFNGLVVATGPGGINLVASDIALNDGVNLDAGSLSITNSGAASCKGPITGRGGLNKLGGGKLTLLAANHYDGPTNVTKGILEFDASETLPGGLRIWGRAEAIVGSGGNLTISTSSLWFDGLTDQPSGVLDLTNNRMLISYAGQTDPITTIGADIASGYNGGRWNGPGISSSTAAANPSLFAVGYVDSLDGVVPGLAHDTVLVRFTMSGDTNLDGAVGFDDLVNVARNYGASNADWSQGDFDGDRKVNFNDLAILARNYGRSVSLISAAAINATTPATTFYVQPANELPRLARGTRHRH